MQAALDAIDIKLTYGVVIGGGLKQFLAYAKRKDSVSHDFQDEQGIMKDLSSPRVQPRQFTLKCALIANSLVDFHTKNDGFFTALILPGPRHFYVADHDRTYLVYYVEQQNVTGLSKIINTDKVGIKFDLVLSETNPADNIPAVYLVDDQDRFLTA
jgi:hypothetical protein